MKIIIKALIDAPISIVGPCLHSKERSSREISNLFPEITDVVFENGSVEEFGPGTVFHITNKVKLKDKTGVRQRFEVLEYIPQHKLVQRITDKLSTQVYSISLTSQDSKTEWLASYDIKSKSWAIFLEGFMMSTIAKKTAIRLARIIGYIQGPDNKKQNSILRVSVYHLPLMPLWLYNSIWILLWFCIGFFGAEFCITHL